MGEDDERFMRLAEEEAVAALGEREVPVGCVFMRDGEVIARGHNRTNLDLDPTRHAELVAVDALLAEQHQVATQRAGCFHSEQSKLWCAWGAGEGPKRANPSVLILPSEPTPHIPRAVRCDQQTLMFSFAGCKSAQTSRGEHALRHVRAVHHVRHSALPPRPVSSRLLLFIDESSALPQSMWAHQFGETGSVVTLQLSMCTTQP